jgi:NAD(P)-dependent dehydrogenase (short-subunit alcohol dehydrogenase family)
MALQEFDLSGKVAIVTGAGKGIGKAIALTLAEAGADIVAAARTRSDIEETAAAVQQLGRKALAIPTDVSQEKDVEEMAKQALSHFGKVDILVNNAAAHLVKPVVPQPWLRTPLSDLLPYFDTPASVEDWHAMLDTNIIGVFLCVKAVGPQMIQRRSGKIINISSIAAMKALPFHSIYGASKAAVSQFTRNLALEWARYNINVNAIAPGYFHTFTTDFAYRDEKVREGMLRQIPLRRFGQLREVGLLAAYLASDAASYITGQVISLDGGLTL